FVLLMIIYHATYVSVLHGLLTIEFFRGFWWVFPRFIAAGFVTLSGWSLSAKNARGGCFRDYARRAAKLAVPALAVSLVSLIMFGKSFVFFGILHLLALSSILAAPLLGRPVIALATGLGALAAGMALGPLRFAWPWLAWLGFRPGELYPVDYLPLLPWFAWICFGASAYDFFGRRLKTAPEGRSVPISSGKAAFPLRTVLYLGRHSLIVYLAHLPILYGLAWLAAALFR
ncbi:MAG: DUF1624 domain-containing protein, partial [Spirochaetales bacterium]